jgi:hypothetical protein
MCVRASIMEAAISPIEKPYMPNFALYPQVAVLRRQAQTSDMCNPALTNLVARCHCYRLSQLSNTSWRSRENHCRDMPDQSGRDQIASSMHSIASYVLLASRYPRRGKTVNVCLTSNNRKSHAMSNIRLFSRQNNLRTGCWGSGGYGVPYPCRQYPSQSRNPPLKKTTTNQPRIY